MCWCFLSCENEPPQKKNQTNRSCRCRRSHGCCSNPVHAQLGALHPLVIGQDVEGTSPRLVMAQAAFRLRSTHTLPLVGKNPAAWITWLSKHISTVTESRFIKPRVCQRVRRPEWGGGAQVAPASKETSAFRQVCEGTCVRSSNVAAPLVCNAGTLLSTGNRWFRCQTATKHAMNQKRWKIYEGAELLQSCAWSRRETEARGSSLARPPRPEGKNSPEGHAETSAFSLFTSGWIRVKLDAVSAFHLHCVVRHQAGYLGNQEAACGLCGSTFITFISYFPLFGCSPDSPDQLLNPLQLYFFTSCPQSSN